MNDFITNIYIESSFYSIVLIYTSWLIFSRFVKNLFTYIISFKPRSVYELARISGMDVSNLNKIIQFFVETGVIRIKTSKISGREVKTPIVDYDEIIFRLAA